MTNPNYFDEIYLSHRFDWINDQIYSMNPHETIESTKGLDTTSSAAEEDRLKYEEVYAAHRFEWLDGQLAIRSKTNEYLSNEITNLVNTIDELRADGHDLSKFEGRYLMHRHDSLFDRLICMAQERDYQTIQIKKLLSTIRELKLCCDLLQKKSEILALQLKENCNAQA